MALDKTKPHGEVFGDELGRTYMQGDKYFNADGSEWVMPAETPASAAVSDQAKFEAAVEAAVAERLKKLAATRAAATKAPAK